MATNVATPVPASVIPTAPMVMKGKKDDDAASNYWLLHGSYYDFTEFVDRHPGGHRAILLGKGRDCTALFESYHTNLPADALLQKYRVTDVKPSEEEIEFVAGKGFTFAEDGFYRTVKKRARQYFKDHNIPHTKANAWGILMAVLNIIVLSYLCFAAFVQGSYIAAFFHGIARALLIIRPNHASSHYALFQSPELNQWAYRISMFFSGTSPAQWTQKHVVAHHLDTNISPMDDDTMYPIKRVLPGFPRMWFHKYQHIYMWILYPFTMVFWTTSNLIKLYPFFLPEGVVYEGVMKVPHESLEDWLETWVTIGGFAFHRWILPFLCMPAGDAWMVLLLAEMSCSAWFALQFAVNHEVEQTVRHTFDHKNGNPKESHACAVYSSGVGKNSEDWGAHQVLTAHNYGVDSFLSLHLSGGLSLQIEHHLFPSVHFHHYAGLSREVVQKTCKEFNIPYTTSPNFLGALRSHHRLMYKMGRGDTLE
eukprot:TRINITY_DN50_c0_g1_i1.p1 TRINITY_DN50_c0_g1~~TRINITY_DN50_c0_g1_i1.p1  ORF type:complete len:478 (+),score=74.70 TRINITY_DN50_c0_g1_i1:106-1539(+)